MKNTEKKSSFPSDWHPADIKAALEKKGFSLSRIAREHGYAPTSPSNVFRRRWAAMEKIIANIVGVSPHIIWPSRYSDDSSPYRFVRVARAKRRCND
ncbi:helix-turn-helix domain-containing protein [Desulfuromonas acetoxidans]|uniref:helix-turn-helix domain-containing protein n=1 Tax=Desulfuromonas acetoxidans TaxID=891 RepID=UPI0003220FD4|nr:helix-turn-helix transcriptional regulator [Desulfuromonas acetoxidans]MBF0646414.1 helix-turn-helix domain-containing protein [Desulfuromonas acetoxidans]NVD24371.1 helix-turn-helix domain-containing protein [Desulfuromonas acetoxidans]NVE16681.1 helix-turn-helix domain-containing protein [Desulfuromonas acetoxidans]